MLRASSQNPAPNAVDSSAAADSSAAVDISAVVALVPSASGIPHGRELLALADAVNARDPLRLRLARQTLFSVSGRDATYVTAAIAVAANFQMMNRILDATGVPVNPQLSSIGLELGFSEGDWAKVPTRV